MPDIIGEYAVTAEGSEVGKLTISRDGLMTVYDCVCPYAGSGDVLRLAAVCGGKYVSVGVMVPDGDILHLKKHFTKSGMAGIGLEETDLYCLIREGEQYKEADKSVGLGSAPVPEAAAIPVEQKAGGIGKPIVEIYEPGPEDEVTELPPEINETDPAAASAENYDANLSDAPVAIPIESVPQPRELESTVQKQEKTEDQTEKRHEPEFWTAGKWRHIGNPGALFEDAEAAEACRNVGDALTATEDGTTLLAIPVASDKPFPMMPIFCFGHSDFINGQEYIIFRLRDGKLTM